MRKKRQKFPFLKLIIVVIILFFIVLLAKDFLFKSNDLVQSPSIANSLDNTNPNLQRFLEYLESKGPENVIEYFMLLLGQTPHSTTQPSQKPPVPIPGLSCREPICRTFSVKTEISGYPLGVPNGEWIKIYMGGTRKLEEMKEEMIAWLNQQACLENCKKTEVITAWMNFYPIEQLEDGNCNPVVRSFIAEGTGELPSLVPFACMLTIKMASEQLRDQQKRIISKGCGLDCEASINFDNIDGTFCVESNKVISSHLIVKGSYQCVPKPIKNKKYIAEYNVEICSICQP